MEQSQKEQQVGISHTVSPSLQGRGLCHSTQQNTEAAIVQVRNCPSFLVGFCFVVSLCLNVHLLFLRRGKNCEAVVSRLGKALKTSSQG